MIDINLKIKTTYSEEINIVTVKSDCKVEEICKEIEKYSKIPPHGQKLIFRGKILQPENPISYYRIENGSTLIMVKTTKTEKYDDIQTSSKTAQSIANNISSNSEENVKRKDKTNLNATNYNIPINKKTKGVDLNKGQ